MGLSFRVTAETSHLSQGKIWVLRFTGVEACRREIPHLRRGMACRNACGMTALFLQPAVTHPVIPRAVRRGALRCRRGISRHGAPHDDTVRRASPIKISGKVVSPEGFEPSTY